MVTFITYDGVTFGNNAGKSRKSIEATLYITSVILWQQTYCFSINMQNHHVWGCLPEIYCNDIYQ